jgi:hypothetical protein
MSLFVLDSFWHRTSVPRVSTVLSSALVDMDHCLVLPLDIHCLQLIIDQGR